MWYSACTEQARELDWDFYGDRLGVAIVGHAGAAGGVDGARGHYQVAGARSGKSAPRAQLSPSDASSLGRSPAGVSNDGPWERLHPAGLYFFSRASFLVPLASRFLSQPIFQQTRFPANVVLRAAEFRWSLPSCCVLVEPAREFVASTLLARADLRFLDPRLPQLRRFPLRFGDGKRSASQILCFIEVRFVCHVLSYRAILA